MVERVQCPSNCPADCSDCAGAACATESPQVWASAHLWANRLNRRGICDVGADDLVNEAWLNSKPHIDAGRVRLPAAYLRSAIRTVALIKIRRHRAATVDPFEWPITARADEESGFDEVENLVRLRQTIAYLEEEREHIWARLRRRLGDHDRADEIWSAAVMALGHLMMGEGDRRQAWDLREVLMYCMTRSSAFWETAGQPGEDAVRIAERRRKRVSRDLPFVSYVAVWEGLSHAFQDNRAAMRSIAARHEAMLRILEREWRGKPQRQGPLADHVAEVRRLTGAGAGR